MLYFSGTEVRGEYFIGLFELDECEGHYELKDGKTPEDFQINVNVGI